MYTQQQVLGRGWQPGEVEQFYQEMRQVGRLYGVREKDMPPDWVAFRTWFDEVVRHKLERSDVTDRVFAVLSAPKPPPVPVLRRAWLWNITGRAIAGGANAVITAGLLPPELRELLGVPWNRRRHALFVHLGSILRATVPRLPESLRLVPQARRAIVGARQEDTARKLAGRARSSGCGAPEPARR